MARRLLALVALFVFGHAGADQGVNGGGSPGGTNGQIQFNNNGAFGGTNSGAAIASQADTSNLTATTPNCTKDVWTETSNVAVGTFTVNAPGTCTPVNGQKLQLWINVVNTQTYSWNGVFAGGLPATSSSGSVWDYFYFQYNSQASKWVLFAYLPGISAPLAAVSGGTGEAGTVTGIPKANGTSAFTAAAQSDAVALVTPGADAHSLGLGTGSLTQGGITGTNNTGVGQGAPLGAITSGVNNTAVGYQALKSETIGTDAVAIGDLAGAASTNISGSVFVGSQAASLAGNNISNSVGIGYGALQFVASNSNTAVGYHAGNALGSGSGNNALYGSNAGINLTTGASNILIGPSANITTGSSNLIIGNSLTGTTAGSNNQIDVGDILFLNSASTAVPVISACGTSPTVDARANSHSGTVTVGTVAAASCTITFASAYASFVHCRVTSQSVAANFAYSYTTAAITVTATSLISDKLDYDCDGL